MQDTPRVALLTIVLALLVMPLSGCVATPSRLQDRNGDFIMNIGSGDNVSPAPVAVASAPQPKRTFRPGSPDG